MSRQKKAATDKAYNVDIIEKDTGNTLFSREFTKKTAVVCLSGAAVILIAVIYLLIAFTPIRVTIPGYPDATTRNEAVINAIRIDSLETIISRWEFYAENLSRVVDGKEPLNLDTLIVREREAVPEEEIARLSSRDSLFRSSIGASEPFEVSGRKRELDIDGVQFFTPLKGVVSRGYEPVIHPYIDITAPSGSMVKSVLDGTVVFAEWSDEYGYTIIIQHEGGIISVCRHNRKLLRKAGDKVAAGAPISLVGSTGAHISGDHLHFELWHRGELVDPTRYISF